MSKIKLTLLFIIPVFIAVTIVSSIIVGLIYGELGTGLLYVLFFYPFWLAMTIAFFGIETFGRGLIPEPNALGWILTVLGSVITITAYYFVTRKIASWWIARH